jgi:hypothetical protein
VIAEVSKFLKIKKQKMDKIQNKESSKLLTTEIKKGLKIINP